GSQYASRLKWATSGSGPLYWPAADFLTATKPRISPSASSMHEAPQSKTGLPTVLIRKISGSSLYRSGAKPFQNSVNLGKSASLKLLFMPCCHQLPEVLSIQVESFSCFIDSRNRRAIVRI